MSNPPMSSFESQSFKLLVGGYINVNVIDGSAFFLSGLTAMCAGQPSVEVSLITANPVEKREVLHEVLHHPNVSIIDPYNDSAMQSRPNAPTGKSMSREQYAETLGKTFKSGNFDALLLRDTETGFHLIQKFPQQANSFSVYITGVTSLDGEPDPLLVDQIRAIVGSGARLVAQTVSMAESIASLNVGANVKDIFVLPPHIPDAEAAFADVYQDTENPSRLAYTGKFFRAWNADKILASFKAVKRSANPALTLEVAGDQFRRDSNDPYFVENVKHLLVSTDGLVWHGRVPRAKSREIIARSHVGIGWRAAELDNSTELSTKILEYGALGRPSILNRNALHEDLLGEDYPLFVNSTTEFKALLTDLGSMADDVKEAAERCYELSRSHWYSTVLPSLMEHLGNRKDSADDRSFALAEEMFSGISPEELNKGARACLDGMWLRVNFDDSSDHSLFEVLHSAQTYYVGWRKVLNYLKGQLDSHSEKATRNVATSAKTSVTRSGHVVAADSSSIVKQLQAAELRVHDLEKELAETKQKYSTTSTRLRALRSSKLGKVQMRIWEFRKRKK